MENLEFLTDDKYGTAVKGLIGSNSHLDMAVSYWSHQVLKNLGLSSRIKESEGPYRVICDLKHVACHWQPIEEFIDSNVCVKSIQRIHCKVWIGENQVIVGSANSSGSALRLPQAPFENLEAGVRITDEGMVRSVKTWFDLVWNSHRAKCVTEEDIRAKKENHPCSQSPYGRPLPSDHLPPRSFEYFVGEQAGRNYRISLKKLGFCPGGKPGNLRIRLVDIEDSNDFSNALIDAIEQLLREARCVGTKKERTPMPLGFTEQSQGRNRVLYERIAELVESCEDNSLWLESGDRQHSYSLRLAHKKPRARKSIALLTLQTHELRAAQDR